MSETHVRERPASERRRALKLVDTDIHPMPTPTQLAPYLSERTRRHLERFGRRTPIVTELYPRASNGGFRLDARGEPGAFPGSDLELIRRQLLDEYDVDYGILNCLGLLSCHEPPEIAADLARAYNDWMLHELMEPEPRLLGAIVVPYEYPELAVAEIERFAGDRRWAQVMFPDSAEDQLGSRKYWPIFEAAAAHGLPVGVHTAGMWLHLDTGWPSYYLEEHVANATRMATQLINMVCEGLFARVPALKVVLTESGISWAASVRWSLDNAYELLRDELPQLERKPSEYLDEHVWFTTQPIEEPDDPTHLVRTLEHARLTDRIMFATDYPHWDFDSPTTALADLPKELRTKVLAGTAAEVYGLPLA
jgi:predicted TIM-barrel fold metal-dependent hydrolase